jgi:deoxyribose-phosphate aldolase
MEQWNDPKTIAALIDHTLLKPEASRVDIERVCAEAAANGFACAVVNPVFVPLAAKLLRRSGVKVCTVAGFPLGAHATKTKIAEARLAIAAGAREIDMVIHIGALKFGDDAYVRKDIAGVVRACRAKRTICKVIIETCLLTDDEKVRACLAAKRAGADFVKTSTGFSSAGATEADVALMCRTVGSKMGVKASGGIRSLDDLLRMVAAGANRIGTSSGVKILEEARARFRPLA